MEAGRVHVDPQLDRLRRDVDELRASRRRLALADDAERRDIERELHRGVQQHLIALAASVQVAAGLLGADRPTVKARLDELADEVDLALAEAQELARRIYPPLLNSGGLGVAIRSAAASAKVPTRIDVDPYATCPPEVARAVYVCCLEVLERATSGTEAAVMVHEEAGTVAFEVIAGCATSDVEIVRLRDRVEALGGRLTVTSPGGRETRVAGSIPL